MDEERRKAVRVAKPVVVRYNINANTNEYRKRWDETQVKNLSETGAKITTMQCYPQGTVVTLNFSLPNCPSKSLELQAKVIDCQPLCGKYAAPISGMSLTRVEFIHDNEESRKSLREYVDWVLKRQEGEIKKPTLPLDQ